MSVKNINLDVAQRLDITARRGDTFKLSLTFKNSDDTPKQVGSSNYLFYMQVRDDAFNDSANSSVLSTDMDANPSAVTVFTGTPPGGVGPEGSTGIIVVDQTDGANGNVTFTAHRDEMSKVLSGTYYYDIQAETIPDADAQPVVSTWITGRITIVEDVTISSTNSST